MDKRLIKFEEGDKVKILEVKAGEGAELNLQQLGLDIGSEITISKKLPLEGPVSAMHNGKPIVIGRGLAAKVVAEKIN